MRKRFFSGQALLLGLPLWFLALFYFLPFGAILTYAFFPQGALELSGVRELFTDAYYARVLGFTVWQAALSTLLTVLAALPAAYILRAINFAVRRSCAR